MKLLELLRTSCFCKYNQLSYSYLNCFFFFRKFKDTFIVVLSILAELIPIYCIIKLSEKENEPKEIVTETKTPSYHNLPSTVVLSSDEEEPHLEDEESLTETEDDTDKPRQIVRMIRKVPMKDAGTQTDDEFSSDDDSTFRNQRKPKKKQSTKSRNDSIARRTVPIERVDKLVEQTRKHDQWTSTDHTKYRSHSFTDHTSMDIN